MPKQLVLTLKADRKTREAYEKITYGNRRAIYNLKWSRRILLADKWSVYVPDGGGVYRLIEESADGRHVVYYVGRSDTLSDQFLQHLPENESNNRIRKYHSSSDARYFRWAVLDDSLVPSEVDEDCKDIEWWLYQHFEPDGNDRGPGHSHRYEIICVNPEDKKESDPVCYRTDIE